MANVNYLMLQQVFLKTSVMSIQRRGFMARVSVFLTGLVTVGKLSGIPLTNSQEDTNDDSPILDVKPLGFQWETQDPFLFCVHHEDYFPKGNAQLGPDDAFFKGRHLGDDFIIKDGFRMYHGKVVPGFPGHPHRGFETVTVVRKGIVDHTDSMGAAGRYGNGDVQWMTAGKGVQHAEMFPLIHQDKDNPLELFQIWLNLPKKHKMVEPHFKMFWKEAIPRHVVKDTQGHNTTIEVIAGQLADKKSPTPPPDSWAADANNEVLILNIKMDAETEWVLPKASAGVNRTVYFYEGDQMFMAGKEMTRYVAAFVKADVDLKLKTSTDNASILVLQGKPIGEPVIQYGPFVMNTKAEIHQAFEDYHNTQFGGWPWQSYDYVHEHARKRFAKHADGNLEEKESLE